MANTSRTGSTGNTEVILGRALHALNTQGWDPKRISDTVGLPVSDVEERLSIARNETSTGMGERGTSNR